MLIKIQTFSFMKMHLKISSAKWRPFRIGLDVLLTLIITNCVFLPWYHHVVIVPRVGGRGLLPSDCRPCLGQLVSYIWLVPYSKLCGCHDKFTTRSHHVGRHYVLGDHRSKSLFLINFLIFYLIVRIPTLSLLMVLQIVVTATCGAANHDRVGIMTISICFCFQ